MNLLIYKNNLNNLHINHDLFSVQGTGDIDLLGKYKINEKDQLLSFGYSYGDYINNHELIPFKNNANEIITEYYGNILIVKCSSNNICSSFNSNDYEKEFIFQESFNMKSINDKLEEQDYENNIQSNLVNTIASKLVLQLSLVK